MTTCCGWIRNLTPALGVMVALAGCAKPEPVLYPNTHLNAVGRETAEWDIANCEELAETYGASHGVKVRAGTAEFRDMTTCCGWIRNLTPALGVMVALAGCAKPEPVLYPNTHLNAVGRETAEWELL